MSTSAATNNPPAVTQLGEANFMRAPVSCIISAEESNCFVQVAAYALTFFIALALTLTVVGIFVVLKGVSEYKRQSLQPEHVRQVTDLTQQLTQQNAQLREQNTDTNDLLNAGIRRCGTLQDEVSRLKDAAYRTGVAHQERIEALQAEVQRLQNLPAENAEQLALHAEVDALHGQAVAALEQRLAQLQAAYAAQEEQLRAVILSNNQQAPAL